MIGLELLIEEAKPCDIAIDITKQSLFGITLEYRNRVITEYESYDVLQALQTEKIYMLLYKVKGMREKLLKETRHETMEIKEQQSSLAFIA